MKSRWRTPALIGMFTALTLAGLAPVPAGADEHGSGGGEEAAIQQVPKQTPASGTNPYSSGRGTNPLIGLLAEPEKADYAYWRKVTERASKAEAKAQPSSRLARPPLIVDEAEPDNIRGGNDTLATAQRINGFGTAARLNPGARVLGTLAPAPPAAEVDEVPEDNGSITLAGDLGLVAGQSVVTTGTIGDGPHGSAGSGSGDFDFLKVEGATAGQVVTADTDTPDPSELDSMLGLWDADGNLVDFNDDDGVSLDSALSVRIPADGDYFVSVHGFPSFPADPFDSASGDGADSEGTYTLTVGLDVTDVDVYAVNLRAGDVLGGTVGGAANLMTVFGPGGRELVGSGQDASFIYPAESPLPGGGNAVFAHVAARNGRHFVAITQGAGNYDALLEVYRPGSETRRATQTLFVDFDGQRLNTGIFGGRGVTTLSPLSAFLGRWGLTAADEDAVIDQVMESVRENVRRDLAGTGARVRILNSRDHADPFGQPNVSRLIVGGTIEESGVPTIGIAQSIDPGNFEAEETGLILLDLVSSEAANAFSFNAYLTPASDRVRFVGTALGNITAHEAGHYLGSFHVDQFNDVLNLMDQGGNFPLLYGVGADGVGGTADDPDVDFGEDVYNPNEGFTGTEDTRANTLFALFRP